ncbi:MAG: CvpA family protein [Thermomicrobiales bacterium]
MNMLDIGIVVAFTAITGVGFLSGISKVVEPILALYLSAVFAGAFYESVTTATRRHLLSMGTETSHLLFFIVLFLIAGGALTATLSQWIGNVKLPRRVEIVDNLGGSALGIIVSGLAVTLAVMLLSIMLQALNQSSVLVGGDAAVGFLHTQINQSALVPVFLKMAPFFVQMISPWFPSGLPPILSGTPIG